MTAPGELAPNPVVDKLEADHQHVSTLLDDIEIAAGDLTRVAAGGPERKEPSWQDQPRSA